MPNAKPKANAVTGAGPEDTATPIALTLTGADADGTIASFRLSKLPPKGVLFLDPAMTIAATANTPYAATGNALTVYFRPEPNFFGAAKLEYVSIDDLGAVSSKATGAINVTPVNDAPTAVAITATGKEDTTFAIKLKATDIDGKIASYVIETLPANGALYLDKAGANAVSAGDVIPANAKLFFKPDANFSGATNFQFSAIDNNGATSASAATATIQVAAVNDAPVANAVTTTGSLAATIPVTLTGDDVDGAVTKFQIVKIPPKKVGALFLDPGLTTPLKANAILDGTGEALTVYFKPAAGFVGAVTFQYSAIDDAGAKSVGKTTATINVVLDATPPDAPLITGFADDTGTAGDGVTGDAVLILTGTAEAGATITVYDGSTVLGTTVAAGGNWNFTTATLLDGGHTFTATATDAAGNVSADSSALAVTIDATAPAAPSTPDLDAGSDSGSSATDNVTSDATPTFTGTAEAGSLVRLFDGLTEIGSGIATGGNYSITVSTLSGGAHNITATATDAAGNVSAASGPLAVTIDAAAPAAPSTPDLDAGSDSGSSATDNVTSDATPTFTGTAEAGSLVRLFDGLTEIGSGIATGGNYSITVSTLSGGAHNITATATDAAGNVSAASSALAVTIDAAAPAAPSTPDLDAGSDSGSSATDNVTSDATPTFTGTAEAGSLVRLFDGLTEIGSGIATGGNYSITVSTLSGGAHNITATATDAAGNVSVASSALAVTIDAAAPAAPSTPDLDAGSDSGSSATDNVTSDATPTFTGTAEAGSLVRLFDGLTEIGSGIATGGNYSITVSTLSGGAHNITATATDAAGNVSADSSALAVTIDATAPAAPSTPDLDADSDSGSSATDNVTSDATPTFTGTAEAGSLVRLFDGLTEIGSGIATGGNYSITVSTLSGGAHNITATATDAAGNVSADSSALAVTIDAAAPAAPSTPDLDAGSDSGSSATDNLTNDATPTFTGTAEAGSLVRLFDGLTEIGSGIATGGNYSITVSTLSGGAHNITATATDAAGNVSADSSALAVTIDATAPAAPEIESFADDTGELGDRNTTDTNIQLSGTAEENAVVTIYDGATLLGPATADSSGAWTFQTGLLADGEHSFTAIATDAAGNVSVTSSAFVVVVNNTPPETNSESVSGSEDPVGPNHIAIQLGGFEPDPDDTVASIQVVDLPLGSQGVLYSNTALTVPVAAGATFAPGASLYFKPAANFHGTVTFNTRAVDSFGLADPTPAVQTITVTPVNDAPTGSVTIGGTVAEDQTLTAVTTTLADVEGLGTLHYQWQRDSGFGFAVVGSNSATYLLDDADVGAQIRVVVSYIDGEGKQESVFSNATASVANVNDVPTNLQLSNYEVVENVAGATVGVLSATDPDPANTITYSIRPGLDASLFAIVGGELRVGAAGLDYESSPTRSVTVRATDSVGTFVERTFTIDVLDRAEFTLTAGTDTLPASNDNTQVVGNSTTLNATDNLNGGGGTDSLVLYGGGTFNLNNLAGYVDFEEQRLVNFSSSAANLTLRNGTTTSVVVSGGGQTSIQIQGTAQASSIQGGDGTDFVNVTGTSAWNSSITISGGSGQDALQFSSSGTYDLRPSTLTSMDRLFVYGSGTNLLIDADTLSGFSNVYGDSGNQLVTAQISLDLSGKAINTVTVHSTNATGTEFTVNSADTALQIFGGAGSDTIRTTSFAFTNAQRDAIFATTSIETIIDTSGTYTTPPADPLVFKLTSGTDVLTGTGANETFNASSTTFNPTDNLNGGGGTDSLVLYGGGTFNLNNLAGYVDFEEQRLVNFSSSAANLTLRNGTTTSVVVSGGGQTSIQIQGTAQASSIQGGDGTDFVNVTGTSAWNSSITISGGSGQDALQFSSSGTYDLRPSTLTSMDRLFVYGSGTNLLIDADTLSGFSNVYGDSGNQLVTAQISLDLSGKAINTVTVHSTNATGTEFTVNSADTALQIFGGAGSDTIRTTSFAFTNAQRDAIFATTSIETIIDTSGTYTTPPADPLVFKLTSGTDVLTGTGANETFNASSTTFNPTDNLNGGGGTDSLVLYGGGTFNLNNLAGYVDFEEQRLVNFSSSAANLTLRNGTTTSVVVSGGGQTSIQIQGTAQASSIQGGDGTDFVYVTGTSAWNSGITISGGSGQDALQFSSSGTYDLRPSTLTSMDRLFVYGSGTNLLIDADTLSGFSNIYGDSGNQLVTAQTSLDLSGKAINTVTVHSTNATGTEFTVNSADTALQIFGGAGSDTIRTTSFAFTNAQRDAIFATTSIETIIDTSGFYGNNAANTITGTGGADNIASSGGNDRLTGGAGEDTVSGGAGADTFVFNFANEGMDTTDFVSGEDTIEISAAGFGGGLLAGGGVTLVTAATAGAASVGDANGYFIFATDDDTLYWDADGDSGVNAVALMKVLSGMPLAASDFLLA